MKKLETLLQKAFSNKLLLIILLFSLTLRLVLFTELQGKNECEYAKYATIIANGSIKLGSHISNRIGHLIPTAFFIKPFGVNKWSFSIFPLISALGFIITVYLITKRLFNKKNALLASFIGSILPINVFFSTIPNSDMPILFYSGLAVVFFLKGYKPQESDKLRPGVYFLLSGIFVGFTYLTKLYGAFMLAFFAVYLISQRQIRLRYFIILIGFFSILLLEGSLHYIVKGDFFGRYRVFTSIEKDFVSDSIKGELALDQAVITSIEFEKMKRESINRLLSLPSIMFNPLDDRFPRLGLIFYFTLFGMIYSLFKRRKEAVLPVIWIITIFLLLNFFGWFNKITTVDGESHYVFIRGIGQGNHARYLYMILIPCLAMSAWSFFEAKKVRILKPFLYAGMGLLIALSLFGTYILNLDNRLRYYNMNQIKGFIDSQGNTKTLTDYRTKRYLDCLNYFENTDNIIDYDDVDTPPVGSLVLLNLAWIDYLKYVSVSPSGERGNIKYDHASIPPNWEKLKVIVPRARRSIRGMIMGRAQEENLDISNRAEVYRVKTRNKIQDINNNQ